MIQNDQDDVFVAVRVQDPRIQNEGSWNSFVDYKIFLHCDEKKELSVSLLDWRSCQKMQKLVTQKQKPIM